MISAVVAEEYMEDVARKPQSAVIVDGFDGGEGEEEDGGSGCHAGDEEGESAANGVKNETLQGVIIESSKGVGDHKGVVLGMDMLVQELVDVHVSVHEVLPCIHNHHGNHELPYDHKERRLRLSVHAVITYDLHTQERWISC